MNWMKSAHFSRIGDSTLQLCWSDTILDAAHNGTTFIAISEILMTEDNIFTHRNKTFADSFE